MSKWLQRAYTYETDSVHQSVDKHHHSASFLTTNDTVCCSASQDGFTIYTPLATAILLSMQQDSHSFCKEAAEAPALCTPALLISVTKASASAKEITRPSAVLDFQLRLHSCVQCSSLQTTGPYLSTHPAHALCRCLVPLPCVLRGLAVAPSTSDQCPLNNERAPWQLKDATANQ